MGQGNLGLGMLARIAVTAAPEQELKFQLGLNSMDALAETFPPQSGDITQLHAVYFDTPTHALRDAGFSLRVRRDGDVFRQTLKHRGDGGLFARDEWEVEVAGSELDLGILAGTPASAVIGDMPLEPVFTVSVERRLHSWTSDRAVVQVTLDTGSITIGEKCEPVAELELEMIDGEPAALFELARILLAKAALTLAFASKAERGYRLAGHDGSSSLQAHRTAIGSQTTAGVAFQIVARDSLIQIAGNAALLQRSQSPEVLHQLRVGLRRLRTAMTVFKAMLDTEGLAAARHETRWLAGALAQARDIDVFLQNTARPDEAEESPGRAAFLQALRLAQTEGYEQAMMAVRSPRYDALLLSLGEWIEVGPWLRSDHAGQREMRDAPVAVIAPPIMDRLHDRLKRHARGFADLDASARHELRKRAKTLRYTAGFLGDSVSEHPKRRLAFMAHLRAMQDRLGELNDMAVAQSVAMRAVARRSGMLAFAAGLELGRMTHREGEALKSASRAVKTYRKSKAFWNRQGKDFND